MLCHSFISNSRIVSALLDGKPKEKTDKKEKKADKNRPSLSDAEATRFELVVQLPVRQFSKLLVSATHPHFRSTRGLPEYDRKDTISFDLHNPCRCVISLEFLVKEFERI